ncbi:hypothetical protein BTVI_106985 [Pitangus sulphuratus]|nr:hypothetical protein BTVI_106985 [Pitangus sulphuratus]
MSGIYLSSLLHSDLGKACCWMLDNSYSSLLCPGGSLKAGITQPGNDSAVVKKAQKCLLNNILFEKEEYPGKSHLEHTVNDNPSSSADKPKATVKDAEMVDGETPHHQA